MAAIKAEGPSRRGEWRADGKRAAYMAVRNQRNKGGHRGLGGR